MTDWDSTIPTIRSGSRPAAADWDKILTLDSSLTDAWTDYSASLSWTGSGSNPVIGNGSISAAYKRYGKTVKYRGNISMGSTTTYGSGTWLVSLPITALDAVHVGAALTYDNSVATARTPAVAIMASVNSLSFYGPNGLVTPTAPFTWATSDSLRWSIEYEAA